MFKKIAVETTILLIAHNVVLEEKREAYTYGLELFFENLFFYGIIFIIALLTKTLAFSALFIFLYKMLRQYTGGFHCRTAEKCLLVSVMIYLIILLLHKLNLNLIEWALIMGTFISIIIVFIFSPRESKNRPLETGEKIRYRVRSIVIAAITALVAAVSYKLNISSFFYSASCSLTADAVLIIISLGRCKNEEENA